MSDEMMRSAKFPLNQYPSTYAAVQRIVELEAEIAALKAKHVATPSSHPEIPDNSKPVARVTGYYGGRCVIEPLDRKSIFPVGMAMYVSGGSADAIDWEGVAADQAMTIAMMQVDYQQLSMQTIHDFGREQEARENAEQDKKDAARYRWLRDKGEPAYFVRVPYNLWDETIDAAMQQEQKP